MLQKIQSLNDAKSSHNFQRDLVFEIEKGLPKEAGAKANFQEQFGSASKAFPRVVKTPSTIYCGYPKRVLKSSQWAASKFFPLAHKIRLFERLVATSNHFPREK